MGDGIMKKTKIFGIAILILAIVVAGVGVAADLAKKGDGAFASRLAEARAAVETVNANAKAVKNVAAMDKKIAAAETKLDEAAEAAQQALDDWNATDSSHPADQFAANTALGSAVEIMYGEVADAGKSTESIETQHTEFLSRQDIILRTAGNEYNPAVEEYNNTLSAFPANVIGTLWGIGEVEAFQ